MLRLEHAVVANRQVILRSDGNLPYGLTPRMESFTEVLASLVN